MWDGGGGDEGDALLCLYQKVSKFASDLKTAFIDRLESIQKGPVGPFCSVHALVLLPCTTHCGQAGLITHHRSGHVPACHRCRPTHIGWCICRAAQKPCNIFPNPCRRNPTVQLCINRAIISEVTFRPHVPVDGSGG